MNTTPSVILVSSADDIYFHLVQDLFLSLLSQRFASKIDFGLLDVGLTEPDRAWLSSHTIRVERAGVDIDFPGRDQWERKKPGFRTLSARLFMRRYFPGYDIYIWMDADTWVQTPEAIDTMIVEAAKSPAIQIACELDRCYRTFFEHAGIWHVFRDWYNVTYGSSVADFMALKPMLNAGVWAMAKDSPLWDAWTGLYAEALQRMPEANDKTFMADQLGLNVLIYMKQLPHTPMPAHFNWLTFHALPMFDRARGLYVEPLPPHRPISIFHLTRLIKTQAEKIACTDGSVIERPLTFGARPSV